MSRAQAGRMRLTPDTTSCSTYAVTVVEALEAMGMSEEKIDAVSSALLLSTGDHGSTITWSELKTLLLKHISARDVIFLFRRLQQAQASPPTAHLRLGVRVDTESGSARSGNANHGQASRQPETDRSDGAMILPEVGPSVLHQPFGQPDPKAALYASMLECTLES
jgi:hypothetical protein